MAAVFLHFDNPAARPFWEDFAPLAAAAGDPLEVHHFRNQWVELQVLHGWAACGRNACPARMIENGMVVSEFLVCSDSSTYVLEDRFFRACGIEHYLAPGD